MVAAQSGVMQEWGGTGQKVSKFVESAQEH